MSDTPRLLVIEGIIGPPNQLTNAHLIDLIMMVTVTGAERTEEEFRAFFEAADLKFSGTVPTASDLSIIEILPA